MRLPAGVTDSKRVTEKKREALFAPICFTALDYGIGYAWPDEIDTGPYRALQLSYSRALADLDTIPDLLYVDGKNKISGCKLNQVAEPKADLKYKQVSAASLIAKVFRDKIMMAYSKTYPQYRWEKNKGYGSFAHEQAIKQFGIVKSLHRRTYCKKFLSEGG